MYIFNKYIAVLKIINIFVQKLWYIIYYYKLF